MSLRRYLMINWVLAAVLASFTSIAAATSAVENIRIHAAPEKTRLVFDISEPIEHTLFLLENPRRLVIDMPATALKPAPRKQRWRASDLSDTDIDKIRFSSAKQADLRVVLELSDAVKPRSFLLKPVAQYGNRLVVDLFPQGKNAPAAAPPPVAARSLRDIVIAIDPGHGGDDPGAIGPGRTYEKTVVLAIAKVLAKKINAEPGFKAVLTRGGDYYLAHRKRTDLARERQADAFLSIHADAWKTPDASGASVFAISERGATSETARWIAEKENRADLIGGVGSVSLDDKDDVLASVLLDLSMTASLGASLEMGQAVLDAIAPINKLHKKRVEQASFIVLKSPDIPSILIETGFISNPGEAKKLRSSRHQNQMAQAIFDGVYQYFSTRPPEGTAFAAQVSQGQKMIDYTIQGGDTLSEIAVRFRVSQEALKTTNALKNDRLKVGQVLKIPGRS